VTIKPTDEMVAAFEREGTGGYGDITDTRAGLAAAFAILARDFSLVRPTCDQPKSGEPDAYCELPRGHPGGHSATVTRAVDW
jgi:hypothetical protein